MCPYAPISATKPITVAAITLTFDINKRWAKTGEVVTLSGSLKYDTTPRAGSTVEIVNGNGVVIGNPMTDSNGNYSFAYTVPFKDAGNNSLPCTDKAHYAYHTESGATSATKNLAYAYNTRVTIDAPATVAKGMTFATFGQLQYESSSGVWTALGTRTVRLDYDTTLIGNVTTATDGTYSKSDCVINTVGSYTLKASYAGEGIPAGLGEFAMYLAPSEEYALGYSENYAAEQASSPLIPIAIGITALASLAAIFG